MKIVAMLFALLPVIVWANEISFRPQAEVGGSLVAGYEIMSGPDESGPYTLKHTFTCTPNSEGFCAYNLGDLSATECFRIVAVSGADRSMLPELVTCYVHEPEIVWPPGSQVGASK